MKDANHRTQFAEHSQQFNLFNELLKLIRSAPGIAIAVAYIILLLTSMGYLHILFSGLGISILKYITLEDMLATPIKNPDIIFVLIGTLVVLYLGDAGNRLRGRLLTQPPEETANKAIQLVRKVAITFLWAPANPKTYMKSTCLIVLLSLVVYINMIARIELANIKAGEGLKIDLLLSDADVPIATTLLGTTVNYVFTYDTDTERAHIYYVEAIKSIVKQKSQKQQKSPVPASTNKSGENAPLTEKKSPQAKPKQALKPEPL